MLNKRDGVFLINKKINHFVTWCLSGKKKNMYKELEKLKKSNNFTFKIDDSLDQVCNAPENGSGIFIVYTNIDKVKELIMVGSTGTIQNNGTLKIKNGGLYDKIVNGHQFAKTGRKYSWPAQMKLENLEELEVYWYETFNQDDKLIPTFVEGQILQLFLNDFGKLPKWNVAF